MKKFWNNLILNLKSKDTAKISTYFGLTTTILVAISTLGIALYTIFFVNDFFGSILVDQGFGYKLLIFRDSIQRLVFTFLTFGLIASYYMTKAVIRPLEELIKGTEEIAEGHMDYRLKKTNYQEINQLIENYNSMAERLNELYSTLEKKVEERTQELANANKELKSTQVMMVHSEKMRSLGQLVAGITHEINNPVNFIYGNMVHLKNYSNDLIELIEEYEKFEKDLTEDERKDIKEFKDRIDLEFLKEDLPSLIKSCHEGTERTKNIILDLKNFSRIDEMVVSAMDIKKEIDTTLNILHNKLKNRIEIVKEYEDDIPEIACYGGQLNQVFMNILDNSCYAIKDKGTIYIRLKKIDKNVQLEIEDSGSGMSKEQMEKVFEPFFTTKPVGQGTGLGMSISYKVIKNHHGDIKVTSELEKGTKFTITLPITFSEEENK